MIAAVLLLACLSLVTAGPDHAPCYEAYLGDNSAVQNINFLRGGAIPAKPRTEADVWAIGWLLYQSPANYHIFSGIAWGDDTAVIIWRCDAGGGTAEFCSQFNPRPPAIVNFVSQSMNGNKNWRSFALQTYFQAARQYVTRPAVQYLASGRYVKEAASLALSTSPLFRIFD